LIMAWECEEHGMHMNADLNIVEFLKEGEDAAPGEAGEVVGTNLWNKAMPFIRYNLEDIASFQDDECVCGRGLPLMHIVQGRKDDFLVMPSGRLVGPRTVKPIIMTFPGVDKLRIIQERRDVVVVQIVQKRESIRIEELKQKLKDVLEENVTVKVDIVDDIPKNAGKLRAVISKVKS
jgi:phenylacetate-CoA ligase